LAAGNAIQFNDNERVTFKRYDNEMTMNSKGASAPLKNTDNSKSERGDPDINALKNSFKEKYDKMNNDWKWQLSCTGRVVEDVIYECISDFTCEQ
jgi:hypothetical protein